MSNRLPTVIDLSPTNNDATFDSRLLEPALYESVVSRRCLAFFIDWIVLGCLFFLGHLATCTATVVTLGLTTPLAILIVSLLPILYGTWTIGGRRHATPGMRAMDLTVLTWQGRDPDYLQALLMTILFYATALPLGGLLLLFALFDRRHRCLHDHLSGVLVVRGSVLRQIT